MALGSYVTDILRELAINIALLISGLIGTLYDVILSLGTSKLFTDDFYVNFATKIGLLLGIYMLFKLMFSLINYLIDPDKINDKKEGAGKIVVRVIVVIVLLATYNTLFRTMYDLQDKIMTSDFFLTLFFDQKEAVVRNGGKFALQYAPIMATIEKAEDASPIIELPDTEGLAELYGNGGFGNWFAFHVSIRLAVLQKANIVADSFSMISKVFPFLVPIASTISSLSGYAYHFNAIPCLLFAGFLCYSLFVYAIKIATRVAQLALLQLIAPVPIISYVDPKSDSLKKWAKMTLVSYADVFVRMAIFYFIAYFSYHILDTKIGVISNASFGSEWLVKLLIMCGVLIMANKFPDLLKKIFNLNDAGEFGLSVKNAMGILYNPFRKNNAMIGGTISSGVGAFVGGGKGLEIATSMLRGGKEGLKSGKFFASIAGGYNGGLDNARARSVLEAQGPVDSAGVRQDYLALLRNKNTRYMNRRVESNYLKSVNDAYDAINDSVSKASVISEYDKLTNTGIFGEEEYNKRVAQLSAMKEYLFNKSVGIDTVPKGLDEERKKDIDAFLDKDKGKAVSADIYGAYNDANTQTAMLNTLDDRVEVTDEYGNNINDFHKIEKWGDVSTQLTRAQTVRRRIDTSAETQQLKREDAAARLLRNSKNKNGEPMRRIPPRGGLGGPPPGGPRR